MSGERSEYDPYWWTWRYRISWRLALICWSVRLDRLGNHFEDVAHCGKGWLR